MVRFRTQQKWRELAATPAAGRLLDIGDVAKLIQDYQGAVTGGGFMKPESRLDVVKRHVVEAEAAVARQMELIKELANEGHSTKGSRILLELLEDALQNAKDAQAILKSRRGLP